MEDDVETMNVPVLSPDPSGTLASDSLAPPVTAEDTVAAPQPEMQTEHEDTSVSEIIGTETLASDSLVASDLAEDGGAAAAPEMKTEGEELSGDVADEAAVDGLGGSSGGKVEEERERDATVLDGGGDDVAGTCVTEGGELGLGVSEIRSEQIDIKYVEDLGVISRGNENVEVEDGGVLMVGSERRIEEDGSSVSVPILDELQPLDEPVADEMNGGDVLLMGCERKSEEDGSSVSVPSLDELQPLDELVANKMDGGDELLIDAEKIRELGGSEVITGIDDVAVEERDFVKMDSERKSGEEGGEGENLTIGDEIKIKDEAVDEVLVNNELIIGKNDVEMGEGGLKIEEEGAFVSVPSLDEGERENLSLMETGLEGEKSELMENNINLVETETETVGVKSPNVADDAAVDTEMETEKEEREGDEGVEERDASQMELEDEEVEKNTEDGGVEGEEEREDDEDEAMAEEDVGDTEGTDATEEKGGKRKRGKNSRVPPKAPAKKVEEDVCFICFDGGDLVLCDRRGCPKAYHPSCVNRDEAFFRAKGRWNCGWHQCSICEKKNAYYMCYTCTFSLCKACTKDAVISCVRGNKGFCDSCMETVTLIENAEKGISEDQVDFDDKSSWLYLFKDYWLNVKNKLSLSAEEISQAKNPYKGSDALAGKRESPEEAVEGSNHQDSSSDSDENLEASSKNKKRKTKKRLKSRSKEESSPVEKKDFPPSRKPTRSSTLGAEITFKPENTEWASKELLEFVMHMKNGDKSAISQFDVQALLLEYIKTNKLRDPRRKSQIICDARLQSLFGKPRVGHFEMLKLLESHFLIKESPQADENQGTVVDEESNNLDADGISDTTPKGGKYKSRRVYKKARVRRQSNLDDYAAIDMHNIGLIFLRRKLVEDLLEDDERFCDKVVGTFVRIRISASTQKQDMYRLVKVLGTSKTAEPYKVGKRTTDLMLEILNLNKKELVSIDTISNQEFTEEECTRLRQSIKCGLISRLTVGDILDKATEIQAARVSDWLESEIVRVSHLRDRASDLGRRKDLRECVEKLQLLKTPEERRRRLEEVAEIHADPNMDPDHESEEHDSAEDDNKQGSFMKARGSAFSRRGRDPISPRGGNFSSVDSWSGSRQNSGKNFEYTRSLSNTGFSNKNDESDRYIETQQANIEKAMSPINSVNAGQSSISFGRSESFSGPAASEISLPNIPAVVPEAAIIINESEKMWHYKDPAGKAQGPFSIVQLRKWSKNGYFPADLRIWKTNESEDISILLTDALNGIFNKQLVKTKTNPNSAQTMHNLSVEVPKHSANKSNDLFNPPSPTPNTNTPTSLTIQTENIAPANHTVSQENISPVQVMSNLENGSNNSVPSSAETVPNISQQMGMPYQTAPNGQNLDPNNPYSMPIQTGNNPWLGTIPNTVQNPSGSFPMAGYQDQWGQPVPNNNNNNQPNFPIQMAPNVPWGMGMAPNMGWGMAPNMNWAPMVNPGWVAPNPMPNQGWVAPSGGASQVPPPGNLNPVAAQPVPTQGWVAPAGVSQGPPPGNQNSGWGPPAAMPPGNTNSGKGNNSGGWGTPGGSGRRNEDHRSGSRFSGNRDRDNRGGGDMRPYRPKSYDSHGNRICPYFLEGYCKKGSRCDMVHQNLPKDKM